VLTTPDLNALTFLSQTKHPNFDPSHELEEILLEDNPLRAKRRTKDLETMSPEMKKMEELSALHRPEVSNY
jgi:hypothetical protein